MSYIQLKVRSGGIYIKQNKDFNPVNLNLSDHPTDKNQKVLPLVRSSSLKGLFAYLMGETQKIKKIENSTDISIQKLNTTLDIMVQASACKKVSELYVTTFFERRDVHTKNFKADPNVNLHQHTFETANPTIKLFKQPLRNIFETNSLGTVNEGISESKVEKKDSEYDDLKNPRSEAIPNTKLGKEMKIYFKKMQQKGTPIYKKTMGIIDEVNSLCLKDSKFGQNFTNFNQNQFSSFACPKFTKFWVDKKYHKIVRGKPAFIACVDFNVYFAQSAFEDQQDLSKHWAWDELIEKLRQGPNLARWGEGGVAFVSYEGLDEMGRGYEIKDDIFVQIK